MKRTTPPLPGRWGVVECSVNEVGRRRFDQLARTGHEERPVYIAIAALGIRSLRVPVL